MHTDEVCEVIKTMAAGSLTLVMVGLNFFWSYLNQTLTKLHVFQIMDSMDWFDPNGPEAAQQARIIKRGLKTGGRVFLRSAAMDPWYIAEFEKVGFVAQRVGLRTPGTCIDRYV